MNPLWLPTVIGGVIGVGFSVLNRYGLRRYWREPSDSLNVVITGSTRGIGKAIARELLRFPFSPNLSDYFYILMNL